MDSKIYLRRATIDQLSRIVYITKLAYMAPYKENTLITKSHEPKDLKAGFLSKKFFVLTAFFEGKIVGAVRYKIKDKNQLYLFKLAVLKSYRQKGVGGLLMQELEKVARKKGYSKILLDCAQEKRLHEYYQKLGYEIDSIKKHLDHHDIYMSKIIK